jgi:hypothetical protein
MNYGDLTSRGSFDEAVGSNQRRRPLPDDVGARTARLVRESREAYFEALDWAERAVPDEHGPFAASAAMTLRKRNGNRWPTSEQVRARLIEQGRDMKALEGMGA